MAIRLKHSVFYPGHVTVTCDKELSFRVRNVLESELGCKISFAKIRSGRTVFEVLPTKDIYMEEIGIRLFPLVGRSFRLMGDEYVIE